MELPPDSIVTAPVCPFTEVTGYGGGLLAEYCFTLSTLPKPISVLEGSQVSGRAKAKDTFVANELQSVATDTVSEVSAAALANAPVFTGKSYSVATTADTALKDVAFTATNSATIVNKVEYVKPEVKSATLVGEAATSTFAGTEVKNALVTGVSYDKADATAAFSVAVTPETDVITKTAKTVEIEVTPVAKA